VRTGLILLAVAAAFPSMALAQEAAKPSPAGSDGKTRTVGEVVVTGQVAPVLTSIDRKSYSVAGDLQAQGGGAIADVLRNVPSVEVDVQGNVSLRGDANVTILIDGKPSSLFQGDNKGQALQSLPADSIDRVEVITNPSAEFRAEGTGGVINLISKKARGAGATGSLRAVVGEGDRYVLGVTGGYNSPRLNLTGDVGLRQDTGNNHLLDDRLQRTGAGAPFTAVEQRQLTNLIGDSVFARGSVDYDLTPRTRIGAESHFNYSFFRVDNPTHFEAFGPDGSFADSFDRQLSVHQKRAAGEVSLNLREKLGADGEFTASLSGEELDDPRVRFGHTFDLVPATAESVDEQRLNYHLHRYELKGDLVQPFADMSKLKAGFDVELADNSYRNRGFRGAGEASLAPDAGLTNLFLFRQTVSAAYVTYEKPIGALTVLAGLRVEDVRMRLNQVTLGQRDENDYLRAYPSLHLGWKLSDDQTLSASYSHRVQRPDPLDFNSFRFLLDPLNFRAGNPGLKPAQTQSYELGYERRDGGNLLIATLFYRQSRDGVLDVLQDLGGGVTLSQRENLARSRAVGLELTASGKLTSTLSYNLSGIVNWKELDSLGPQFAPQRSLLAESGRGSITWQATPKDLFQLNGFANQKGLTPQGTLSAVAGVDLGYRRKLTDKLFVLVTLQDILNSFHGVTLNNTPLLMERSKIRFDTRQVRIGFTWAFGGGRPKDPGFEFQTGSGPTP